VSAAPDQEEAPSMRAGDETLHVIAAQVRDGDRILDPPDDLRQESVTVRGAPRIVTSWRGHRVVVNSTGGVFQLGATDPVTVRRASDA
jgi:transposase